MHKSIFEVDVDFLSEIINNAIKKAFDNLKVKNELPLLLTRTQLMELLDIGSTKASELLNREDFPVIREFGHPRVPTHLFMIWIEEHTEWVRENTGNKSIIKV
ncbi:hypothetical protein ABD76_25430 [Paenibacillus dendritiformis]|uniref:DNA-binding protein n=1 Tax=Paenibacillus dendritiformis TaxID=130049 RepID=UPI0018CFE628|nr:DNA-binding protein [Paenibacillus dendritiformis]MBG9795619.1 hypothetical protein [Paenibacillus dendritiformis]